MKVCAFGGHHHKMHKKLKRKGLHGGHHGMKACQEPFEQRKCHFKKGKGCEKNKHNHGGKHHGHKRHGPRHVCLHSHGLKHFSQNLQNSCEDRAHHGDKSAHHGHGGQHHGPGVPNHEHSGLSHGHDGPSHGHGGPNHGHGRPNHGHNGPNHDCGCNRANFYKEHHGKHHKHAEKRHKHQCQCFSRQGQSNPHGTSCCLDRSKSI